MTKHYLFKVFNANLPLTLTLLIYKSVCLRVLNKIHTYKEHNGITHKYKVVKIAAEAVAGISVLTLKRLSHPLI